MDAPAPSRLAAPLGARQALLEYSQQKIDADAVMRALAEHPDWHVPIHALDRPGEGLIVYEQEFEVAPHQLNVFLDRASADLAAEKFGGAPMGIYASGVSGQELFGNLRKIKALDPVKTLQVNPGSPTLEQWFISSDAFGICDIWSQAVRLEDAIARTAPGWAELMRQYPAWLGILARGDNSLVKINLSNKGEQALIFTAPDHASHFLNALPDAQRGAVYSSPVPGEQLFKFLIKSSVKGFLVNANSNQTRAFDAAACRTILGLPQG